MRPCHPRGAKLEGSPSRNPNLHLRGVAALLPLRRLDDDLREEQRELHADGEAVGVRFVGEHDRVG